MRESIHMFEFDTDAGEVREALRLAKRFGELSRVQQIEREDYCGWPPHLCTAFDVDGRLLAQGRGNNSHEAARDLARVLREKIRQRIDADTRALLT